MDAQIRYSVVARWFHWIIAIFVIANIGLGLGHDVLGKVFPATMTVHKSIGLTVLLLTIGRLVWRVNHRPPPLPASMSVWEKSVSAGLHHLFYALMLLVPLSGWLMASASPKALTYFGLFDVYKFGVTKGDAIFGLSREGHEIMGLAWGALIILHIAAVLRHQLILKDNLIRRMI